MDILRNDLRYALRRLRGNPAFTAVVVLTLALGIGANSAIFSVVDTVLLKSLPYPNADRLVTIYHDYPTLKLEAPVSAPGFRDYRDRTHDFESVAVERGWSANLTGVGDPQRLSGARVSGLFFRTMGIAPALGRPITPAEDEPGKNHIVVLSDGLWHRLFGGDPHVIGRTMSLNGEPYEIAGVMPASFHDFWTRTVELWTPLALPPQAFAPGNYTNESLNVVARLRGGITLEQAGRDMQAFAQQLKRDYPDQFPPDWTLETRALSTVSTGKIRPALLVLLGAVGFVLLIACANVANLLLARAAGRSKEVAIRTALGASRRDVVRQLLVESVTLSLAGGALGLGLAWWSLRALRAVNPENVPRVQDLGLNGTVLLFTLAIALATGVLFGLVPALQMSRSDLNATLREGGRSGMADRSGKGVRRALVVAEVALALMLLTGAGLLLRSFARLQGVDPGFDARNVLTFTLSLPQAKYPSDTAVTSFFDAVLPRIRAVPGVRSAAAISPIPFSGQWSTGSYNVEGYTPPPNGNMPWGDIRVASPGYFSTLRIPVRRGHGITQQDGEGALPVAVVDEEFVRRFLKPGDDPIGHRLWFGSPTASDSTKYITIIGVVSHTKQEALDADARPQLYLPYQQAGRLNGMDIAVRTTGDPRQYVGAIRRAIQSVDADQPMSSVRDLDEMVSASLGQRRMSTVLLGTFAGIALVLACIGLYGVMAYSVSQRAREMGIRMALGARHLDVMGLVLRQGMTLVLAGIAIGVVAALLLTRVMASQLYDVRATDPATFVGVALLLAGVAFLATYLPARRATHVDPVVTLREE
ncbi:MAG TPA: ABC transporter permease [Gemmatimonadaceae bacterium]|jgi:putative ABC transport system permease protein|nr:ABC transporter permease [Gemmatimonadaceae bacterium]